jgi:hypothetical protein
MKYLIVGLFLLSMSVFAQDAVQGQVDAGDTAGDETCNRPVDNGNRVAGEDVPAGSAGGANTPGVIKQ